MSLSAGKYRGLSRLADRGGRFKMLAADQRPPIRNPIRERRGTAEAPWEDVAAFKRLLVTELQEHASAVLLDPHYGFPAALHLLDPRLGLLLTLEDSIFEDTPDGRLSSEIDDWSVERIKRAGGDAVKVLAWYRPDAPAHVLSHQHEFTRRIGAACARYDIPFILELLVYPLATDAERTADYVEMRSKHADHVLRSVETFAAPDYGVDLFKLESPVAASDVPGPGNEGADAVQPHFDEMGRLAARPWVVLSAGAGMGPFRNIVSHACRAGASGYLAGRAIWAEAFAAFPDWDAIRRGLREGAVPYMRDLNRLTDSGAQPWHGHPAYGPEGAALAHPDATFRSRYEGFGDAP